MLEILPDLQNWISEGDDFALATVVRVVGSGPRVLGSMMGISGAGQVTGSVSGGCVEAAVIQEARQAMQRGRTRLLQYHISHDLAWEVGLSCGGSIEVLVEPLSSIDPAVLEEWIQSVAGQRPVASAVVVGEAERSGRLVVCPDGSCCGHLDEAWLEKECLAASLEQLRLRSSARTSLDRGGVSREVFIGVFLPPPQLIVVGAGHFSIPLVEMAKILGYRTVVIDPRSTFASRERFPGVDELMVEDPLQALDKLHLNESTCLVTLSHDDKIDLPALERALAAPLQYIGALGSRKTFAHRMEKLKGEGWTEEQLARIHAPVGLNLGAVGPREIAVSILAEIISVRHGPRSAGP